MPDKKPELEGFEEFLAEYNAAELPNGKPANSRFSLRQQLKRFSNFFHSEKESKLLIIE